MNHLIYLSLALVLGCGSSVLSSLYWNPSALRVPLRSRQWPQLCPGNLPLSKIMLNQSGYVQYFHYITEVPDISSFTMHYWFNLVNDQRTSTMFEYIDSAKSNSSIRVQLRRGQPQIWTLEINDRLISSVASPLIKTGEWHHMVHSWDHWTGSWSVFMNGHLLETGRNSLARDLLVNGGGNAVSGQRQNTLGNGMDRGEGLEGWITLFQMSNIALMEPDSSKTETMVRRLASTCDGKSHGNVISWTQTPRKHYGGGQETPAKPICGSF